VNDLLGADRLRLRRLHADARDSVAVLRAKLCLSAARLRHAARLLDPPSASERASERATRAERRRSQLLMRSLDAALTARLRPPAGTLETLRHAAAPRSAHYERIGRVVRLALGRSPALARRLERVLLDPARLPLGAACVELAGFGSGTTVFRLESGAGAARWALKVYRRTLGRGPAHLAAAARRYRERHAHLCADFGALVLPASFAVLHAPLRGVAAVACLQPWLEGSVVDVLALADDDLLALLARHGLGGDFAAFARRTLAWHREGAFPDLLGRGNLVLARDREHGPARLSLIDYGIFHPVDAPAPGGTRARLEALAARLESLLERLESDVVHAHATRD
jgi:hypothetical protein